MAIPTPGGIFTWIQHKATPQPRGAIIKGLACPPNHEASLAAMLKWLVQKEFVEEVGRGRSTQYEVTRTDVDPNQLDEAYKSEPLERPPQIEPPSVEIKLTGPLPVVMPLPNVTPPTTRWDAKVVEPAPPAHEPGLKPEPVAQADSPQMAKLRARVAALEAEVTAKDTALANMREAATAERQRHSHPAPTDAHAALTTANRNLKREVEAAREQFRTVAAQLVTAERRSHDLVAKLEATQQQLSAAKRRGRELAAELKGVRATLATAEQAAPEQPVPPMVLVLMVAVEAYRLELEAARQERDFAKTETIRKVTEAEELLALAQTEIANLLNEKDMWVKSDPNPALKAEVERLKAQVKDLTQKLDRAKSRVAALDAEIRTDWAPECDQLTGENDRLRAKIDELGKIIEVLQMHQNLESGVLNCGHRYGLSVPKAHGHMPDCNRLTVIEHS